jgi:long-chain acyl-CoA synthetase
VNDFWSGHPVPPMRHEALYSDRVVRCFAERPQNFFAMFMHSRATRAEHDAVVCEGRRWSYAQTDAEAARIAAGLAARGVAVGERVLMCIGNRPEFVFVLLALQRLGAIAVPVGIREMRPGLAYITNQCGAMAIVFDAELAERIPDAAQAPALRLRVAVGGSSGDSL